MLEMRHSAGTWLVTVSVSSGVVGPRGWIAKIGTMAGISHPAHQATMVPGPGILSNRRAAWVSWFENEIERRYEATGGGLEIIADVLLKGLEDPACLGFPFIDSCPNPGCEDDPLVATTEQRERLRRCIEELAIRMGLRYPDVVASTAVLVIERAIVWARTAGNLKETETARLLFQCLQHA